MSKEGYFFAIPVSTRDIAGNITATLISPSPWGVPLVLGGSGESGSAAEPTLWLALEQPTSWLRPATRLEKSAIELFHVQRFAVDYRGATGAEAYAAIEPQEKDPPDFIATLPDGNRIGLECVAFTLEERRGAQALFQNLRNKVVFQQRHRTGHLTGCSVIVWFGKDQNPNTRPPSITDEVAAEELVEALVSYRPNIDSLRRQFAEGMPPEMPPLFTESTQQEATFYAVPMLNSVPTGPFFSVAGYEIMLAYTTVHTATAIGASLERLVRKHDKKGVDTLLITSGGPDRSGAMYPLEQVISNFYLEHPVVLKPDNISRVIMHRWPTGDAYDLLENPPRQLWPPIYQGSTPAHQLFVVPNTSPLGAKPLPAV